MLPTSLIDRVANTQRVFRAITENIERLPPEWRPFSTAESHWSDDFQWLHDRICGSGGYKNLDLAVTLAAVSLMLAYREASHGCKTEKETAA